MLHNPAMTTAGRRLRSICVVLAAVTACTTCISCTPARTASPTKAPSRAVSSKVTVTNLRCEYRINPVGIDVLKPRLSWSLVSTKRGQKQTAYQIQAAGTREQLLAGTDDLWDTGKVPSDQSIQLVYDGRPLTSTAAVFWRVRIWDKDGLESSWSEPATWSMGLLSPGDWKGKWIGLDHPTDAHPADPEHRSLAATMLRREFKLDGPIKRATVSICGLGYYELRLNGRKVGDHVLDPGLTDYAKRDLYVTYDVTDSLAAGDNAIGVMLGNGRYYAPRVKNPFATETYGLPKMLLQMRVEYADGRSMELAGDESWQFTTDGPIRANNDYDGEEYDARMEQTGWDAPGFNAAAWRQAQIVPAPGGQLAAQMADPIRVTNTLKPVSMTNPQPGVYIYDLGQNMVGWAQLTVQGPRGTRVQMRFAETLKPDGQLFMANLRSVKATDVYILKGEGAETYEPRFAYHGFRYVELTGYPGVPSMETIAGRVAHSDAKRVGSFNSSSQVINRVYQNMLWGIRGNLRSIPTDCPQRDERQGWLGDIANESKAESFDFNVAPFFTKWLKDIQEAQDDKGNIPDVAPPFWRMYNADVTWPATYTIIPGLFYEQYGDLRLIETHYPNLKKWIAFMNGFLKDGIMPKDTYGDWCVPPEKPHLIHSEDPGRKTAGPLLATAYYCKLLKLMARYATLLGQADDARQFAQQADAVAKAFNAKFFNPQTNQYDNGTQTSYVLPLAFDIVPPDRRAAVFEGLVRNITEKTNRHIATGLVGGQWLMRTLSDNGRPDLACTLATNTTYPSWGYMADKGATTIWELWNGDTADPAMNSHNHLMLTGDLGIWLYEDLAGIKADPAKPGFRHILMRPCPVGGLTYVLGAFESQLGSIVSGWQLDNARFDWWITIPPNATATVYVPALKAEEVLEGDRKALEAQGVKFLRMENGRAVFEIDSGEYHFAAPQARPAKRNPGS